MINSQQVDYCAPTAPSLAKAGGMAASVRAEAAHAHIWVVDDENAARDSLAKLLREACSNSWRKIRSTPRAAPIVERLERNALRMNAMIAELLESATLDSNGIKLLKEPSDLGEMVNGILRDLNDASRRRVLFEADGTVAPVLVEPAKIDRAITNLITNALKYSPADAPVRVFLTRSGENVVLEVVDQGIGIAAAHVPKLFERYYRAPTGSGFSGLGLGLYITG